MSWSLLLVLLEFLFVVGYSSLLLYYWMGSMLCPDTLWREFSVKLLPGIALALFFSLLFTAGHHLLVALGYTTIWWNDVPVL